jgi:hypothetical protein
LLWPIDHTPAGAYSPEKINLSILSFVLAYNIKRVMAIIGVAGLLEALAT